MAISGITNPCEYCGSEIQRWTQLPSNSRNIQHVNPINTQLAANRDGQSAQRQDVGRVSVMDSNGAEAEERRKPFRNETAQCLLRWAGDAVSD